MRFYHTKCGGEIDIKLRQCRRCKRKWNPISFRFDPVGIRMLVDKDSKIVTNFDITDLLPKWPRWARILTSIGVLVLVILVIYLIKGR